LLTIFSSKSKWRKRNQLDKIKKEHKETHKKYLVRLARDWFPGIETLDGSSTTSNDMYKYVL